jgi:protease-4
MGSLAASGGYWVSTPGQVIFAEPNTITGSIGIFGILPTFEKTLAKIGVTSDGTQTTPMSGQPDILGGVNPVTDRVLQSAIEQGYARFVGLVAQSRKMTPERVDEIAQGRVWVGGVAHQLKLVDRFGGLDAAMAEAAKLGGIKGDAYYPVFFTKEPDAWVSLIAGLTQKDDSDTDWVASPGGPDAFARVADGQRASFAMALGDARRLALSGQVQAMCLECTGLVPVAPRGAAEQSLYQLLVARLFG